jgi:hypothetical protein
VGLDKSSFLSTLVIVSYFRQMFIYFEIPH